VTLSDVWAKAVTWHWIAWTLAAKGDRKEAIRLIRDEVLPVYEKLNSTLNILRTRRNLATLLLQQAGPESARAEARRLPCLALADARRLKVPEAQQIEAILPAHGLSCD
jgi:hypothetical protein